LLNSDNVLIKNHTSYQVDAEKLMEGYSPPKKKKEPQILILHTHATEGFADQKSSRTTDTEKNVVKIGDALEKALEKKGFNVLHDIVLHDFPDYNSSYKNSLATANWYLEHYPEIDIVFDIHRDAIVDEKGSRTKLTYNYKNKKAAQLMIVSGTNQGGLSHNDWQENLKFAIGLQAKANELYSGLMRPIDLRVERFNGHVTKNALIIEFGTDGNTLEEALLSAELFADILGGYIK
jgi:stage II sporulation protein P